MESLEDDDGFVGATLEGNRPPAFDASAYSFFGDLGTVDGSLEGALEEGLEAPPEEEAADPDLLLAEEEDLSYASMFAAALEESAASGTPAGKHRPDADAGADVGLLGHLGTPADASGSTPAGGSLFHNFDLDLGPTGRGSAEPTPPRSAVGSIALGGLLMSTSGTPGSPFGSVPTSSPFGGFGSTPPTQQLSPLGQTVQAQQQQQQQQQQPQPSPLGDPAIMHMGAAPPVVSSLPGGGPLGPHALTAQELEAQLLGRGMPMGQQQQQQAPAGMPHQQPYYQQGPPPGYMGGPMPQHANGFGPQGMQGPPGYGMPPPGYGMPPPGYGPPPPGYGPPPPHMQQGPPPPPHFSPGAAFPPMGGGRPPPRPIPMQHPEMFGAPPGMPPPHHMMGPPPEGHMMMGGPRPPPGYAPHMRPGMPLPQMRPGPAGPWGPRPPMVHPGMPLPRPPAQQQLQHATLAQRLRALDLADRHDESYRRPQLRRRYYSRYMDHEEIEHILHMQWRGLHQGSPYLEDYYYQAFVYKYYAKRNRRFFAPESVRELAPTEKMAADEVSFVKVEGLGRLPFSNIRRPRPLMDIAPEDLRRASKKGPASKEGTDGKDEGDGEEGGEVVLPHRPLEQEPMLAARIMVEDCMCLILDVLDIDQIFVAAGGPVENEGALRTRRALLLEGLAASLRLPETPAVAPPTPGAAALAGGEMSDGVFLRLMALTKGKKLLARALRVVYPAPESAPPRQLAPGEDPPALSQRPNLRVVWAALRRLRLLFCGGKPGGPEDTAATSAVAAAAAEVLRRLHTPQAAADCLAAMLAGDLDGTPLLEMQPEAVLMPLFAPGANAHDTQRPWLSDILMALLQRAAELDLLPASVAADEAVAAAASWRAQLPRLYYLVEHHVSALHEAHQAALDMGETEAAVEVKALMPISLVRVLVPHCTPEQAAKLQGMLRDLGV